MLLSLIKSGGLAVAFALSFGLAAASNAQNEDLQKDAAPAPALRSGAYSVAALNFNAKRVPFSAFDEEKDGKLGSVYTRLTETLLARILGFPMPTVACLNGHCTAAGAMLGDLQILGFNDSVRALTCCLSPHRPILKSLNERLFGHLQSLKAPPVQ